VTRHGDDAGMSLIEIMVALGIMTVVMTIFTTGMLMVYRATNTTESVSVAQAQLHIAFQRLDKEIRYASWIADPGTLPVRGRWYVEFAGRNAATSQAECRQLRLDVAAGSLQLLRWTPGSPPAEGAPGQVLAANLVADTSTNPFQRQAAGSYPYAGQGGASFAPDYQRLRLRLTTRVAGNSTASDVTFTALNTSRDTADTNVCREGRPA
jgi:Tfp pilus assembly protein PilW